MTPPVTGAERKCLRESDPIQSAGGRDCWWCLGEAGHDGPHWAVVPDLDGGQMVVRWDDMPQGRPGDALGGALADVAQLHDAAQSVTWPNQADGEIGAILRIECGGGGYSVIPGPGAAWSVHTDAGDDSPAYTAATAIEAVAWLSQRLTALYAGNPPARKETAP